jgi:hypothetical protein
MQSDPAYKSRGKARAACLTWPFLPAPVVKSVTRATVPLSTLRLYHPCIEAMLLDELLHN